MKKLIPIISIIILSCTQTPQNTPTDYTLSTSWYSTGEKEYPTDVFYITPTCTWSKEDRNGVVRYNMDVADSSQKARTHAPSELARRALSLHSNFFCPYYAQVSMDSWMETDTAIIAERYKTAETDIKNAFHHYLKHMNNGRPFILAGHSQGGSMVIDILKKYMDAETHGRMIAAYVIGYPITREDLKHPYVKPATNETDTGVVVAYNSVADTTAISPLFGGNVICINPVTWTYDETPAITHIGDTVSLDAAHHTIVVRGADADAYYVPSAALIIPHGNLHIAEYDLYIKELQENTLCRINSYMENE